MNDLISRQAAIDVIDAVFPVDPMKSEYAQGIACGAALAKTYVEQLPSAQPEPITVNIDHELTQEDYEKLRKDVANAPIMLLPSAQQWIPCSERLPEERGFYLTTTKDKAVYCDYWNEDNFDRTEMVIAWMPLPEPWKGAEE